MVKLASSLVVFSVSLMRPACVREKEFFIDILLVRIHLIIEMITIDRPCAMGV